MIRISRPAAPTELSTLMSADRFRHPHVVAALYAMQHGKCCYCEAYIPDWGTGKQVEHFRPQSAFRALINEWSNLLLACATCNSSKGDAFPTALDWTGTPFLLDPSNPELDPARTTLDLS